MKYDDEGCGEGSGEGSDEGVVKLRVFFGNKANEMRSKGVTNV